MASLDDRPLRYARVAVERGLDRYPEGLTYSIPAAFTDLRPGERVVVPLGRSDTPTAGYVIELCEGADLDRSAIKPIARRDRPGAAAALPPQLLELARWISSYYCSPIGMTLAAMMPSAVKRRAGMVVRTMVDLASAPQDGAPPRLSEGQRKALAALGGLPAGERPVEARKLAEIAGLRTTGPVRRLVARGLATATERSSIEAAWIEQAADRTIPQSLTARQQGVVDSIVPSLGAGFSAHLLFGVTGSGKTEVYIRLIERVVQAGKAAIVMVPEIALTPQTGGRLIGRFPGHRVAILHSGLTAAQRHQQWALCAAGKADIVLGARSAVFAPIPPGRLGLIVVDEEHDASYKQDQVPRYHGRDVALRRGQMEHCPVLLGSATPALESWHNATGKGAYTLHRLEERVPGLRVPAVRIVDFVEQQRQRRDGRVHLLGPVLEQAAARTLEAGGQIILLLNRRGYANYIACPSRGCGWLMECDQCDALMVYHLDRRLPAGGFVMCHHCRTQHRLPPTCPLCGRRITTFGLGTQRVEEELTRKFPSLVEGETLLRVDSDSMHGMSDFHRALSRFGRGEVRVLVGTQMIAKGLDFPKVQLVGVINADTAIHLPDFRATERTFQLVSQVAGRCGRGREAARVVVQTFHPESSAIRLAAAHNYEAFARKELEDRRRAHLPPWARMARIVVRDADLDRCTAVAAALARRLGELGGATVRLRGPSPCPIARIAGRYRQQIELLADGPAPIQRLLARARAEGTVRPGEQMAVDVDPLALRNRGLRDLSPWPGWPWPPQRGLRPSEDSLGEAGCLAK